LTFRVLAIVIAVLATTVTGLPATPSAEAQFFEDLLPPDYDRSRRTAAPRPKPPIEAAAASKPTRPATPVRPALRAPDPARGPTPTTPRAVTGSMEIALIRSDAPGCEPTCVEWIAAQGTIDPRAPIRLKRVLARLGKRKVPILVDSPGGTVDDAIKLAKILRDNQLDVVVAQTETTRAGRGRLSAEPAKCASSCPFMLAGGVQRLLAPDALIGVHQAATFKVMTRFERTYRLIPRYEWGLPAGTTRQLVSERPVSQTVTPTSTSPKTYETIEANFRVMGVSPQIMPVVLATPNDAMRWLTDEEAVGYGLITGRLSRGELVAMLGEPFEQTPAAEVRAMKASVTPPVLPIPVPAPVPLRVPPLPPPQSTPGR
jgi:hypothetical protein